MKSKCHKDTGIPAYFNTSYSNWEIESIKMYMPRKVDKENCYIKIMEFSYEKLNSCHL
jgi:hypothetical protein